MKKTLPLSLMLSLAILMFASSQDVTKRIINITYDGGSRNAPDLRYGPYQYTHPSPEGIKGTVSRLTVYGQQAQLNAPSGVLMSDAQGQRDASFTGAVRVVRSRLTAQGTSLNYSESTGFGVLESNSEVNISITPKKSSDEPAQIRSRKATFDVDTDVSVSEGQVILYNGAQTAQAEKIIFEQGRDLAKLTSEGQQVVAMRQEASGDSLMIQADVLRVLTEDNKLLAIGNVTLVDGNITTTGQVVYFDDEANRAEVIGEPARSIDSSSGVRLSGERLEQRTDIDAVQVLDSTVPPQWSPDSFLLSEEL